MTVFGEFICDNRADQGLTQHEVADKMTVPRTVVSMIETGSRIPTRTQFDKLTNILHIKEVELKNLLKVEIMDKIEIMSNYELLKMLRSIE